MGRGKTPDMPEPQPSPFDQAMANIANAEYSATGPIREQLIRKFGDLSSGRTSPFDMPEYKQIEPMYAASYGQARPMVEDQYDIARQNLIGSTPRGGGQTGALQNLESNRARNVSDIAYKGQLGMAEAAQRILADYLNRAYGYATGVPQTAMAGFGGAASNVLQQRLGQLSRWQSPAQLASFTMNPKGKGK